MIRTLTLTLFSLSLLIATSAVKAEVSPEPSAVSCEQEFSNLFPECISKRVVAREPAEFLQSDLRVCNCLETSPLLKAAMAEIPDPTPVEQNQALARLANKEANYQVTANVLDPVQYARSEDEANTVALVRSSGGARSTTADHIREKAGTLAETVNVSIDRKVASINDIPPENESRQCVSWSEYNVVRILPQNSAFYASLNAETFNPQEWNIDSLASRYNASSSQEEKTLIADKISFLQRNHQIRYIFSASATPAISAAEILRRQQSIYETLRILIPPAGSACIAQNRCGEDAIISGRHNEFRRSYAEITMPGRDNVLDDLINDSQARELERIVSSTLNSDPDSLEARTINEYFNRLQSEDGDLITRCQEGDVNLDCYKKMKKHCRRLKRLRDRLTERADLSGNELVREIRAQDMAETNLNLVDNISFEQFNDQICLQQFSNGSESLSFFGFQERYCTETASLPECGDRRALLSRYLSEYNSGEGTDVLSNRTMIANLLKNTNFVAATTAAIDTANRLDETPAQLRERFGGSYPRVGADGTLLPPLPRSGAQDLASDSSRSTGSTASPSSFVSPVTPSSSTGSNSFPETGSTINSGTASARSTDRSVTPLVPAAPSFSPVAGERNLGGSSIRLPNPLSSMLDEVSLDRPDPVRADSPANEVLRRPESEGSVTSATFAAPAPAASASSGGSVAQALPSGASSALPGGQVSLARDSRAQSQVNQFKYTELSGEDRQIRPFVGIEQFTITPQEMSRYKENVQLLAKNANVLKLVRETNEEIVELTLLTETGEEFKVYAKSVGDKVEFFESQFGATRSPAQKPGRGIASVSSNFRVHVKPQTYDIIATTPRGIIMDSKIYERVLNASEDEFRIMVTSDTKPVMYLKIVRDNENVTVTKE